MNDPRDSMIPPDGCFKPFLIGLVLFAVLCFGLSYALGEEREAGWTRHQLGYCVPANERNPRMALVARVEATPSVACPSTPLPPIPIAETPTPVQPQEHCGIPLAVLFRLKETFQEHAVFQGAATNGQSIVVTLSDKGTWTILACDQTKCCVKAAGTSSKFLAGA